MRLIVVLGTVFFASCASNPVGLFRVDEEPAGANCPAGGLALYTGVDDDADGVLGDAEIEQTSFVCDDPPIDPPGIVGNVAELTAAPVAGGVIELSWIAPAGTYAGVMIRRSTQSYPATPADGELAYEGAPTPVRDTGLTPGTRYYYRVFAHDGAGSFASGVDASAVALASGALDPSYGEGLGYVVEEGIDLSYIAFNDAAIDSLDRIVVVGEQRPSDSTGLDPADGFIARFDSDGALDRTFQGDGFLVRRGQGGMLGIAIDAADRLITAEACAGDSVCVARRLIDGAPDPMWNGGGPTLVTDVFGGRGKVPVAIDANGRALVLGIRPDELMLSVTRLLTGGTVDATFGGGAVNIRRLHPGDGTPLQLNYASLTVDADSVFAVGSARNTIGTLDIAVWQLDYDGAPVTGFGDNGAYIADAGGDEQGVAIVLAETHWTLSAQLRNGFSTGSDHALVRADYIGFAVTTFGPNGTGTTFEGARLTPGTEYGAAMVADSQGRLLVAGTSIEGTEQRTALWRYRDDGILDSTFDQDGMMLLPQVSGGSQSAAYSVFVDSRDRIILAGADRTQPTSANRVVLFRVIP